MTGAIRRAIGVCILAACCPGVTAGASQPGFAPDPAVGIQPTGSPETVYRWSSQKCEPGTLPDAPARAFRDHDGHVRLIAAANTNWSMIGPDLDRLRMDCHPLFLGAQSADPAAFDDLAWIEAVSTQDGQTVVALLSDEWNAARHPGTRLADASGCRDPHQQGCYFYAITQAVSHDGGAHFRYPPGRHVAIALPVPFEALPQTAGSKGVATVSNIFRAGGFVYVFAGVRGTADAGNCLLRTADVADPSAWRGWDGEAFSVNFSNPYRGASPDGTARACRPIAVPGNGSFEVRSVSIDLATHDFIAVVRGSLVPIGSSRPVAGFFYSTSRDLLQWSRAGLIMQVPLQSACGPRLVYPSLIDPASRSRDFDTVGSEPYLYYTRFNITPANCRGTMDRDLVRVKLLITPH